MLANQVKELKPRPNWLRLLALVFFIIPLFPFVIYRAWRFAQVEDSNDPEGTIEEIHKMNRLSWILRGQVPEIPIKDRAKIAEQRVLQKRLEEAQREFSKIREEVRNKDSDKAKYLRYYCNYWLASIRGDWGQAEYELRQAEKTPHKSRILWLPEPQGKDDLDLAFDHELIAAAEEAGLTIEDFVQQQVVQTKP